MRLLRLRAYCYPEVAAASRLTEDLETAFARSGMMSVNITPMPTRGISAALRKAYKKKPYEELKDGHILIHRFPMFREGKDPIQRALRYMLCGVIQYCLGIREKGIDLVYSGSTPPILGFVSSLVARKLSKRYGHEVPFIYNLHDIFPDSLVNAGMTGKGSVLWRLGRKLEDATYRNAEKIIVISEDFKANLLEKGVPEDKISVIPNWVDTDRIRPVERKDNVLFDRYRIDRERFCICYSGNLGHSQNLALLVEAAEVLQSTMPEVLFVLIGEGAEKEGLIKAVREKNLKNVLILPFQPEEELSQVFSLGDVGLVISKPGIGGSSVPSKILGIMAAERPVLASFDKASGLGRLIEESGCGICAEADDLEEFLAAIAELRGQTDHRAGKAGRRYAEEKLSKERCVEAYVQTILAVAGQTENRMDCASF